MAQASLSTRAVPAGYARNNILTFSLQSCAGMTRLLIQGDNINQKRLNTSTYSASLWREIARSGLNDIEVFP
jgi:hypothetical protein